MQLHLHWSEVDVIHSQSPGPAPHTVYKYGPCILHSRSVLLAPAKCSVHPPCPGPFHQNSYFSLSVNSCNDRWLYSAHVQDIVLLLAKLHRVSAHSNLQFIKVPLDFGFFICFVSHSIASIDFAHLMSNLSRLICLLNFSNTFWSSWYYVSPWSSLATSSSSILLLHSYCFYFQQNPENLIFIAKSENFWGLW